MQVGVIGLGRMGFGIAQRMHNASHAVIGFDPNEQTRETFAQAGMQPMPTIEQLAQQADIIWLLVPAGQIIDTLLAQLVLLVKPNTIIIDAGNSKFTDSMRRASDLKQKQIFFIDCGTSGGVHGKQQGYCLMVGGDKKAYTIIEPLLQAVAAPQAYAYIGSSGAGHYVKMVHNGIEYGLMQAYAEGLHLLHNGSFAQEDLDLAAITKLWNHGSIVRSWLLQLTHEIFAEHGQQFNTISGKIAESGMGKWTVQEAQEHNIEVDVIQAALDVRYESQKTGGNYATKLVALMRNKFGGHAVETTDKDAQ